MKVKIVDKKDDVKEMTIEEVLGFDFISTRSGGTGNKYALHLLNGRYYWLQPSNCHAYGEWSTKKLAINIANDKGFLCVFSTKKELYLWMAE